MQDIWIVIAAITAIVIIAVPLAAAALVSLGSLREESAHSLSGQAPGAAERAARRLVGFTSEPLARPVAGRTASQARIPGTELRFDHARRPVSDLGQYAAERQSQPGAVLADQRQPAGV